MAKPYIRSDEGLRRDRSGKVWELSRIEADGAAGPLLRVYTGPLARLRSWWHWRNPHVLDPPRKPHRRP